jgi:cytochrome c553
MTLRLPASALLLCAALTALPGLSAAQTAPAAAPSPAEQLRVRALAATCANCHGTDGRAIEGSTVPGLAGTPAPLMAEILKAYRNGSRTGTVMHQIAKGYTEHQIEALAAYFAAQPR